MAILRNIGGIKYISPEISSRKQAIVGDKNMSVTVYGVEPVYAKVKNTELAYGGFLNSEQVDQSENVVVLGSNTAKTLFSTEKNPLGKSIQIGGVLFRVIGVTKEK